MTSFQNIQFSQNRFSWMPLGGLDEVGMNCMLFVFGDEIVPLDAGILFADTNNFGVGSVYPDFRELLKCGRVKNWLISHGHEDHIGAVSSVLNLCQSLQVEAPLFWAPPLGHALICARLEDNDRYPGLRKYLKNIRKVELEEELDFGEYMVRFSEVRHSTLFSCSTGLRWKASGERPELRLLHSGDFKVDLHEFEDGTIGLDSFDHYQGESPDIMFVDSTNAERKGQSVSELELTKPLEQLVSRARGRCFVTLFSSNLYRIANVISIAQKYGKKVCLAGRAMQQIHSIAQRDDFYKKCPEFNTGALVAAEEISSFPADKQLIICSGSQGEFRSVLSKVAKQMHPYFQLQSGDEVIFSSKVIPGNEKSISVLVDKLLQLGAKVHWRDSAEESAGGPIHASGHARFNEIAELLKFLNPKKVIPVHGNFHLLKSCADLVQETLPALSLNKSLFLGKNNAHYSFESRERSEWELVERFFPEIPKEKFMRLERFDSPSRDPFLKARKKAALGGVVVAMVDTWGRVQVKLSGVLPQGFDTPQVLGASQLEERLHDWLHRYSKKLSKSGALNRVDEKLEQSIQEDLERFVKKLTGTKPLAIVQIARL